MDALRADDLLRARTTSPSTKAVQALEAMAQGLSLKRIALKTKHPELGDDALEAMFRAWLRSDV